MVSEKLVSIIIPVYNGSDYVHDAIQSTLDQDYPHIEIIVVNDGSNDDGRTREKVLQFGDRVQYFEKENGGVASALNQGVKRSNGEYISWLSHDDVFYPKKISKQMEHVEALDHDIVSFTGYDLMHADGRLFQRIVYPMRVNEGVHRNLFTGHVPLNLFFSFNFSIHGCSLIIPKQAFVDCGSFDEHLLTTQDYDLWFRMMGRYRFIHLPLALMGSREHPGQTSRALKMVHVQEKDDLLMNAYDRYFRDEDDDVKIKLAFFSKIGGRSEKVVGNILKDIERDHPSSELFSSFPGPILRKVGLLRTRYYHSICTPVPTA